MKKLTSFFVLTGIILTVFFAQEANAYTGGNGVFIHEHHAESSGWNFHKSFIFSEKNTESEDSEKSIDGLELLYIHESSVEKEHIKNLLTTRLISSSNHQQDNYHLPLFLVVRSIRI